MDPLESWNEIALRDPATLSPSQQALFALGWLRTEVNNGGFNQLFFNSAGDVVPVAVVAARRLEAGRLAGLVERALSVLGEPYPTDRTTRQDVLAAGGDEAAERLEQLDREYYQLESELDLDDLMRQVSGGS